MRRSAKIEQLESRRLLNSAVEVWAGNSVPSDWSKVDQAGYTKLGESDTANGVMSATDGNVYGYFVIGTHARVQIDSIGAYNGPGYAYPLSICSSYQTDNPSAALTPGSGVATVGTHMKWSDGFVGYLVVSNFGDWNGVRVSIGSVDPMVQMQGQFTAYYLQGATQPYAYREAVILISAGSGFVTDVQIHSPNGQWLNMLHESPQDGATHFYSDSLSQMMATSGSGTYAAMITSATGTKVAYFNVNLPAWPTQIPSTTSLTQGQTNAPTAPFTLTEAPITDPSIQSSTVAILDDSQNLVFSDIGQQTSFGPITLPPNAGYHAILNFENGSWSTNADGYGCYVSTINELDIDFSTSGYGAAAPDLSASFSATGLATRMPGEMLTFNVNFANSGGLATGKSGEANAGIRQEVHLSRDQVYGNADDIPLLQEIDGGDLPNWSSPYTLSARIPDNTPAGTYYIVGKADAGNVVAESNESNNTGSSAAPVLTVPPLPIVIDPVSKALTIYGTDAGDTIGVSIDGGTLLVNENGAVRNVLVGSFNNITILGNAGNDNISVGSGFAALQQRNANLKGVSIDGGLGDDSILSGDGADTLHGGDGNDVIGAGPGNDLVYGEAGRDALHGNKDNDTLYGGNDNDAMYGDKGNDQLYGQKGSNYLDGGPGNDTIYARNGMRDSVVGGAGLGDAAQFDSIDSLLFGDVEIPLA